ncbi:MAG: hypothetical protein ACK5XN_23545 [Bacteroidota bacterium]
MPAVDQVQQRQLDPGDPLKHALAVLQLARLPRSVGSLHRKVIELHPYPERTWSWALASAYAAVFDAICQASGSSARARSGGGQA